MSINDVSSVIIHNTAPNPPKPTSVPVSLPNHTHTNSNNNPTNYVRAYLGAQYAKWSWLKSSRIMAAWWLFLNLRWYSLL